MTNLCTPPGVPVDPAELHLPKAQQLVHTLRSRRMAFVTYLDSRREADGTEVIILEVVVERGQRTVHDIRMVEPIAVRFFPDDQRVPEVLALREDFPVVPHLNIRDTPLPRSLCLYDEPYDELKLRWTAAGLVERIRTWLALTARGELHATDQPLEPLLLSVGGVLVIPPELLSRDVRHMVLYPIESITGHLTFVAVRGDRHRLSDDIVPYVVTMVWGEAQPHGVIQQQPQTIAELHHFLNSANIDLLAHLRQELRSWKSEFGSQALQRYRLAIVVVLPKTRTSGTAPEAEDCYAFMSPRPLSEIGQQIGIWEMQNGQPGFLFSVDETQRGDDVALVLLNPMLAFSPNRGAALNGLVAPNRQPITAIGAGALGSQIVVTLARMGYGPWTLVDPDIMLPHNLARHALPGFTVGHSKADMLAQLLADMFHDKQIAQALPVDLLHPGERQAELTNALTSASTILDMSASVAVARALADIGDATARRISIFLNPSGTDLVLLAEDAERCMTLDLLELQYYRLVLRDDRLERHLRVDGRPHRVGRSCRDLSVTLPQDLVALHAAIASRALRTAMEQSAAGISVWQADPASGAVTRINAQPVEAVTQHIGGWTICIDSWLEAQLQEQRLAALPNETGGVLLGAIDSERKRIIIVDSIASPPDSVEWPTLYIRGCQDLTRRVSLCEERTGGGVTYIGEWHSHPAGYSTTPSTADHTVLRWLAEARAVEGFPGVMAIVGDSGCSWYLDEA
ncbi:MAG: hypothetical protein OHK0022_08750 [Roseiflexaceae bacterium]